MSPPRSQTQIRGREGWGLVTGEVAAEKEGDGGEEEVEEEEEEVEVEEECPSGFNEPVKSSNWPLPLLLPA